MKSIFTVLFLVASAFAAEASLEVSMLLKGGLEKNQAAISEKAATLSSEGRMLLFEANKKDATVPFIVNFFVGFGIGSYIQGDNAGGTTGLIGDLIGFGLLGASFPVTMNNMYAGVAVMAIGAVEIIVFRIYQWVRPFSFARKYNELLSNVLMKGKLSFKADLKSYALAGSQTDSVLSLGLARRF